MENQIYKLYDYESGAYVEVSKEAYLLWQASQAHFQAYLKSQGIKGEVMLFGTGGEFEGGAEVQKLFFQPNNTIEPFNNVWDDSIKPIGYFRPHLRLDDEAGNKHDTKL